MIVGLGIDLTEVPRIDAMVTRWGDRFLRRVFTDEERAYALGKAHASCHLAARFAAKEAALKALSVPSGLRWQEIEVVGGGSEPPRLALHGRARKAAEECGVASLHLSLTHTNDVAAAVVVAIAVPAV